jgi:hypothetical protein
MASSQRRAQRTPRGDEKMTNKSHKIPGQDLNPSMITTWGNILPASPDSAKSTDGWEFLTSEQARTLRTICDRIIPEDDFPSASQAGVLAFIDYQLAHRYRQHRDSYAEGLEAIETISRNRFGRQLSWLDCHQQIEVLAEFEQLHKKNYDLFRSHTVEGYYGPQRAMKSSSFASQRGPSGSAGV